MDTIEKYIPGINFDEFPGIEFNKYIFDIDIDKYVADLDIDIDKYVADQYIGEIWVTLF